MALQRRYGRLELQENHLASLKVKLLKYESTAGKLRSRGLCLRQPFVCLPEPVLGENADDRAAPPRHQRPSATRIISPSGSALRLELTILALLQLHRRPGALAHLSELGIPIAGSSSETGWADLVNSHATSSNTGNTFYTARTKRAGVVESALKALEQAGLVDVPAARGRRGRYQGFVPLEEGGAQLDEADEYRVPQRDEKGLFTMPPGFILNNWVHVLEDTEIAVLLLAASHFGAWPVGDLWAIPAEIRLRQYGIHRDAFSKARKTLEWFGLLDVEEVGRHGDGRAQDDERNLHRIGIRREGFEVDAWPAIREAVQRQLSR
ncbi:hypothetical protein [Janibacter indicus]|uniref:hypothetical protein n=1 Tax=Janibacter indicus TaxID=857417 RepID=UPI003EC0A6A9